MIFRKYEMKNIVGTCNRYGVNNVMVTVLNHIIIKPSDGLIERFLFWKTCKSPDEDAKVSPEVNAIKEDKHIKYFKLPEDNGWNNGRALLISQGIFQPLSTSKWSKGDLILICQFSWNGILRVLWWWFRFQYKYKLGNFSRYHRKDWLRFDWRRSGHDKFEHLEAPRQI